MQLTPPMIPFLGPETVYGMGLSKAKCDLHNKGQLGAVEHMEVHYRLETSKEACRVDISCSQPPSL